MADLVRVRLNGVEKNMGRVLAEASEGVTVLDEPTHNGDGTPRRETRKDGRPAKKKTTVAQAAAKKAVTESADDKKEQGQ